MNFYIVISFVFLYVVFFLLLLLYNIRNLINFQLRNNIKNIKYNNKVNPQQMTENSFVQFFLFGSIFPFSFSLEYFCGCGALTAGTIQL